ncbi:MAG: ribose-5-phosphate isomerase RpiA [Actinobacteria bacterium]|nr:ribose-5-phosphate isomerase RpiA [Actinomycetota bacterium]
MDRQSIVALLDDPSRACVAREAAVRVRPGAVVGLGSGRAVWATMELLARRDELAGLRVVTASSETEQLAASFGFCVEHLDGTLTLDLAIDGADEVAPDLGLLKGHGAALLREKLVAIAARRFVIVAEASKRVDRLGQQRPLPVEVVRFGCADTARRLRARFGEVTVRTGEDGPLVTDEGNHLLDLAVSGDAAAVATELSCTVGVIEHGLFLDMADEVLLGAADGTVETLRRHG